MSEGYESDRLYILKTLDKHDKQISSQEAEMIQTNLRLASIESDTKTIRTLIENDAHERSETKTEDRKGIWNLIGIIVAAIAGGAVTIASGLFQRFLGP